MTTRAARLGCALIVAVALVVGAGATAPSASAQSVNQIAGSELAPDDVSMRIDLRANGSAAWTVEYRVRLDDENTTEAFRSLQEDIRANESQYAAEFGQRMASTAATAEDATGREMSVRNVSISATRQQLPQDYGVVTYSFVWTNFAVVEDGTLRAGDALAGLFLDSETSLQFTWPEGYTIETVQPQPDDTRPDSRIAVWSGPLDFGPNEPTLVVTDQATGADSGTTTTPAGSESDGGNSLLFGAVAFVALALGAGGWIVYRRRSVPDRHGGVGGAEREPANAAATATPESSAAEASDTGKGTATSATQTAAAAGAGTTTGAETVDDESTEQASTGDTAAAATSDTETTNPDASGGSADDADAPVDSESTTDESVDETDALDDTAEEDTAADAMPWEDELLSNEERVLAFIEHEGGRVKQQEVAQTLDWTDAKTSQVVRKMRDEDELDGFRLGRENVLVLPGEDLGPDSE
ncbi:hypothetical protein [Halobellus sp. H-GB7]|uniref:helix-turn-helix transcriptional regulator n=1 Tax=Halobellus sp. H-GB7 TaxID=3069756 RepID=UPI0027AEC80D|nr:hypothetical protein [Halobellus sp. H-GB7]MDQ2055183.1 hypothetical protein [Halobellus sp. H-GB7]